ncbi:hypothetical protein [Bradyrhizobium sp. AZCC 2289]|uniref:hypothetical protein n=1 Tax=Bradyrhizobium sp. AZCC 2289 TaxID=3117026 RepID=UPI002FEE7714
MSKTNDTSNMNTERELSNDELDAVSSGVFDFGNLIAQTNNATQVGARLQDRRMCGWVVRGCRSGGDQPVPTEG